MKIWLVMVGILLLQSIGHVEEVCSINFESNQGFIATSSYKELTDKGSLNQLNSRYWSLIDSSSNSTLSYVVEAPKIVKTETNQQILFMPRSDASVTITPKLKVHVGKITLDLFKLTSADRDIRLKLFTVDLQGKIKETSTSPLIPDVKSKKVNCSVDFMPGMKLKLSVINSKSNRTGLFIDNITFSSTGGVNSKTNKSQFYSNNSDLDLTSATSFVNLSPTSSLTLKSSGDEVDIECLHFTLQQVGKQPGTISVAISYDKGQSWDVITNRAMKDGLNKVVMDCKSKALWIVFESSKPTVSIGNISFVDAKYGKPSFPRWASEDGDMFGISSVKINDVSLTTGTKHNDENAPAPTYYTSPENDYGYYIHWSKANSNVSIPTVKVNDKFNLTLCSTTGRFSGRMHYLVWLDVNGDGDFSASELLGNSDGHSGAAETINFSIKVPSYAVSGKTRLRLMSIWSQKKKYGHEACKSNFTDKTFGETEDYNVYLSVANSTILPKYASDLKGECRGCLKSKIKLLKSGRIRVKSKAGEIDYKCVDEGYCYIEYSATLQGGMSISTLDYTLQTKGGKQNCLLLKSNAETFYDESTGVVTAPTGKPTKVSMLFKVPAKSGTAELLSQLPTTIKQKPVSFNLK